ncbi:MAG: B3/B4 domain-containing protein [Egibacteraceae bacterium]
MTVPTEIVAAVEVKAAYPGVTVACLPSTVGASDALAATADRIWHQQHAIWCGVSRSAVRAHPHVAAYREFAASLGLDSDRQPPSIQALIDRGLRGKPAGRWPRINPVVDLLNAVAVQTMTSLGAFDADRISGSVRLAITAGGELFHPLGGDQAALPADRLVLADNARVLSLFAQRDGVYQAIQPHTARVLLLGCAVPGVDADTVREALVDLATQLTLR